MSNYLKKITANTAFGITELFRFCGWCKTFCVSFLASGLQTGGFYKKKRKKEIPDCQTRCTTLHFSLLQEAQSCTKGKQKQNCFKLCRRKMVVKILLALSVLSVISFQVNPCNVGPSPIGKLKSFKA